MKEKKSLSVKMDQIPLDVLDEIAGKLGTTRASLVRMLLLQQIDAYKKADNNPAVFLGRKEL